MPLRLGQMLVGRGLVSAVDVNAALERQAAVGGRLGTHLVAMGALTPDGLAGVLRAQREIDEAVFAAGRGLAKLESALGDEHPSTIRARYNLARLLLVAGRAQEAHDLGAAVLGIYKRLFGPKHEWTHDCATLIAQAQTAIANAKRAELLETTAVAAAL